MRKLIYYVAVSIDGFIAGPEGQFDAFPIEGDHMVVLNERFADAIPTAIASRFDIPQSGKTFGAVLMGWNTYNIGLKDGIDSPYSHLEQIVFSRTQRGEAESLTITDADPVEVVRELKQQSGADIWLCGGGQLAAQLIDEIDTIITKRNPILFGDGVPMFGLASYSPQDFEIIANQTFKSGVIVTEYARKN